MYSKQSVGRVAVEVDWPGELAIDVAQPLGPISL